MYKILLNFIDLVILLSARKVCSQKCILPFIFLIIAVLISCTDDDQDNFSNQGDEDTVTSVSEFTVAFSKVYGGSQDDTFHDIITTTDGGFAALGFSQSLDGDITDKKAQENAYWLVKTDNDGNILWSKTYGGSGDDRAEHLIQTADGGFLLAGYSTSDDGDVSQNAGFFDHWIVKLDASGEIQWERSYGFSGSDQLFSVIQTSDGGYFTGGFLDVEASGGAGNDNFTESTNPTNKKAQQHGVGHFWGHKLDANGDLVWRRFFGGSNNDTVNQVIEAQDGGILMIGASESNNFDVTDSRGSYDFWVVRLDAQGNLVWKRSYGGSGIDIAYAATATLDGGYILIGDTRSNDHDINTLIGSADIWLVKIDEQGNLQWEKTLGGTNFESARDIIKYNEGYSITGNSRSIDGDISTNAGQNDIWVASLDSDGTIISQKSFGGNDQDFSYGITTTQNELILAGETQSVNGNLTASKGGQDAVIIKLQ